MNLPYYFLALLYTVMYLPTWVWVTFSISLIHTWEESQGEIWTKLGIPAWVYVVAQSAVVCLGTAANINQHAVLPFVIVRFADVIVTHWIFRKPGIITSPLLIVDALVIGLVAGAE